MNQSELTMMYSHLIEEYEQKLQEKEQQLHALFNKEKLTFTTDYVECYINAIQDIKNKLKLFAEQMQMHGCWSEEHEKTINKYIKPQ